VDGRYQVRWSKKIITDENTDIIKLVTGDVPRSETKVTVTFNIPEASYGTNYVQFLREWRPEIPYNFTFNVLPDLSVSPSSGSPGANVAIKGTGFPAKKTDIKLNFDGKNTNQSIITNDLGSFTAQFTIPDTMSGKHEFKTIDENMSIGDVSASLQVNPKIILEPERPEIDSEVTVTGSGFSSTSQVSIKYDDIAIPNPADKPLTTDANGSFSHKFMVPESSKSDHVVTATDKAGNVATSGMVMEGSAPPSPNLIYPCDGQRFGWFGPQLVTFKWEAVSDPSGVTYTLDVGQNTQVWPPTATKAGLTSTTYAFRLEPGTYFWKIKAIDGAGNESETTLAPYPFKVGFFSIWLVVGGIIIFAAIFILIVRAFFRRVSEYYK